MTYDEQLADMATSEGMPEAPADMNTYRITMEFDVEAEDLSMAIGFAGDLTFDMAETLGYRDALVKDVEMVA